MIDRKDLEVGLETKCGKVVTAIGKHSVLYESECGIGVTVERFESIEDFCSCFSIKPKIVEIVRWANVDDTGCVVFYNSEKEAKLGAECDTVAIAVKMRGSYEV